MRAGIDSGQMLGLGRRGHVESAGDDVLHWIPGTQRRVGHRAAQMDQGCATAKVRHQGQTQRAELCHSLQRGGARVVHAHGNFADRIVVVRLNDLKGVDAGRRTAAVERARRVG